MATIGKLESLGKVIETEILVIGGGVAGLWAANRARELGANVLIVDKGPQDWGGLASLAGGDFEAVIPEENVDDWVKDIVYYEDGLCQQDAVEEIYKHSFDRLKDYQRFGCEFFTGTDGKLRGVLQRGLDHVKLYPMKVKGHGGLDMVRGLVNEANRLGVKRLGRIFITDLLQCDGAVAGAVGFNAINCEFCIFTASAVVLSTGGNASGLSIAYRAGAELKNVEFCHVHNVPKLFAWESQTTLLPLGARFINSKSEPFMDKYCPVMGSKGDTHYNCLGMAFQYREGKGPIYFDHSPIKQEDLILVIPQDGQQLLHYKKLIDVGIDFFKERTEWMPAPSLGIGAAQAGVVVDIKGRTKVPGLFAAGTIWPTDHGVYKGGWNLCRTAVTGHIVGESVAEYVKSHRPLQIDEDGVKVFKQALSAAFDKVGILPKEVLKALRETLFPHDVCILKKETALKTALDKVENMQDELLPQMGASGDAHYLVKLIHARSMALIMELFLRGSLMRTESRAGHYREDYPNRDDKNWLKWIIASQKDGKPSLRTDPVPIGKYKFKSTRYYMDNYAFPK